MNIEIPESTLRRWVDICNDSLVRREIIDVLRRQSATPPVEESSYYPPEHVHPNFAAPLLLDELAARPPEVSRAINQLAASMVPPPQ